MRGSALLAEREWGKSQLCVFAWQLSAKKQLYTTQGVTIIKFTKLILIKNYWNELVWKKILFSNWLGIDSMLLPDLPKVIAWCKMYGKAG